jgi:CheY-like chemotaxis protein
MPTNPTKPCNAIGIYELNQSARNAGDDFASGIEPVLRTVIGEVLDQAGYVVLSKGDLGSAVDALAEINVDLLITHPYVANISGHKAAQYLLTKNPRMGVLIVAGFLDDDRLTYRAELAQLVREKQARMSQSNLDRSAAGALQDKFHSGCNLMKRCSKKSGHATRSSNARTDKRCSMWTAI